MSKSSESQLSSVLITGGTDGLGRAAAELLAARGYRVFAGGRNADRRAELDEFAREKKLPIETLELDVCNDASANSAVSEIERRAGPVDVLINNAGIAFGAVMEEISLEDLRKQFETNFFGVVRLAQRVLPEMRNRRRGRIINMSSVAGKVAMPVMGPYTASKHALEGMSDSLRLELYPFGVQVVLIEPGYIHTNMNANAAELSSAYAKGAESSAYKGVYQRFLGAWEKIRNASRYMPEDCARVILRAVEDTPPRARYIVTRRAKQAIFFKRVLSDRAFDRTLKKQLDLDSLRESLGKGDAK
ncbi:MAG: SDR family NAD(P)-dependent oxidoreductase [Candidatus Acidiferrales bacterium]